MFIYENSLCVFKLILLIYFENCLAFVDCSIVKRLFICISRTKKL